MFTVSMAVGSKELAKRGVLVTRLSASEDAATMDVLCVDKTGTITMNQLAVTGVIPLQHATEADVLFAGALASQEANQVATSFSDAKRAENQVEDIVRGGCPSNGIEGSESIVEIEQQHFMRHFTRHCGPGGNERA